MGRFKKKFANKKKFFLLAAAHVLAAAWAEQDAADRLFCDLETVRMVDQEINDRLPLLTNYQLQGGYFTMPSARMGLGGLLGFGYSYVPPYRIWNLSFQFFDHLETTGNYWIFHGVQEANFGHLGFGDDAERSVNAKICLLRREDGFPFLPDFSIGWNDFLGSRRFNSFYLVATEELLRYHLELTLGWGQGRIKGFFGGFAWSPWRRASHLLKGLSFAAEYDANNYKRHGPEHPFGRTVRSRVNAGIAYRFRDLVQISASSVRGTDWAASASLQYNLGQSKGIFPKVFDPPLYTAPVDTEPIGRFRTAQEVARDLAYAFKNQGFDLYLAYLVPEKEGCDALWLKVVNVRYSVEETVRERIEYVLGSLTPSNISTVSVVDEADGVPVQEYRFRIQDLVRFREGGLGAAELRVIAPTREVSRTPSAHEAALLYQRRKKIWILTFRPWLRNFFGSSTGKFKYETGLALGLDGTLFDQIYYSIVGTYAINSSMQHLGGPDVLNPSRLLIVRTDSLLYQRTNSVHLYQAFLQKSWNLGQGWFTRTALGYFESAYGGLAWESLYYPVHFNWAIGFEAAVVWKRDYMGVGFADHTLKLTSNGYKKVPYVGVQYFVDFFYRYKPLNLDFKASVGQFLARDKGIRLDAGRTFPSGLRVGLWYTFTNANDVVNNQRYYDKGLSITMPLDLFMHQSSRSRIGYAMSAWLRDCGAKACTGQELYPTIYYERFNPHPTYF